MATSLSAAFTAIANAIRAKKGVSTTYTPDEMPDAISSIATATLQTKTTNVTPSANWSGTNTNTVAITPDSGYDGMSQVNVSVPMLRDYTLMTADTVDTPSTVYSGNTSQSNSQKLLRMKPTKDGMSYTGSYLYMQPNSYLGNASASDVLSGKTFSSSNGIQITGTGSGGTTPTGTKSDSYPTNGTWTEDVTNYANHKVTVNVGSNATVKSVYQVVTGATAFSNGTYYTGASDRSCVRSSQTQNSTITVYFDVMEVICFYLRIGVDNIVTHYDIYGNYENPTTKVRKISSSGVSTVEMSSITSDGINGVTRNSSNNYTISFASRTHSNSAYTVIILGKIDALS